MRRAAAVDVAMLGVLGVLALYGFRTVYIGHTYLAVGTAGLVIGAGAALLGRRYGLPAGVRVAGAVLAGMVLAGPLVLRDTVLWGFVPTADTIRGIRAGAGAGWRDLLTTLPPVPADGPLLLVPYTAGIATGLAGMLLATLRAPGAPLPAPVGLLATAILFGTEEPAQVMLQGGAFAAVALCWLALRQASLRTQTSGTGWTRLAGGTAVVLVAAVAAYIAPVGVDRPRFVLREYVTPPFDPSQYPSPLAGFRRYEVALKERPLFTVDGLPAGTRLRMAVMDTYDGVVWSVAGEATATTGSGVFERVGARIPGTGTGPLSTVEVAVQDLDGVWLPSPGSLREVMFAGGRGGELAGSFRYNRDTGVGVVPARLRTGDRYRVRAFAASPRTPESVAGRPVADMVMPELVGVPDEISATAVEWAAGASGPVSQMQALVGKLRAGAFSDGTNTSGVAARPGHGAGRLREFLTADQLVGDAEQYAATLGLLARALGLPVRVVLGVVPAEDFRGTVTGSMVTAWVEVAISGAGWVAFDPTPPKTNKPDPPEPKQQPDGTTEVIQPPVAVAQPPPEQPAPDRNPDRPCEGGCDDSAPWPAWLVTLLVYVGTPLGTVVAGLAAIATVKWQRRRRRRRSGSTSDRVAGGWYETLDRLRDLGVAVPATGTRDQRAKAIRARTPEASDVGHLAEAADEAVFGPADPPQESVDRYWDRVDDCLRAVAVGRSRLRRLTAPVNPSSLGPFRRRRPRFGVRA